MGGLRPSDGRGLDVAHAEGGGEASGADGRGGRLRCPPVALAVATGLPRGFATVLLSLAEGFSTVVLGLAPGLFDLAADLSFDFSLLPLDLAPRLSDLLTGPLELTAHLDADVRVDLGLDLPDLGLGHLDLRHRAPEVTADLLHVDLRHGDLGFPKGPLDVTLNLLRVDPGDFDLEALHRAADLLVELLDVDLAEGGVSLAEGERAEPSGLAGLGLNVTQSEADLAPRRFDLLAGLTEADAVVAFVGVGVLFVGRVGLDHQHGGRARRRRGRGPVSYTHLTLPTKRIV